MSDGASKLFGAEAKPEKGSRLQGHIQLDAGKVGKGDLGEKR